jgi:hypothetical protein
MATIILHHDVQDYASWKPYYDADTTRRENAGFKEIAVGTEAGNPKRVYMIWKGDPGKIESMLNDPELADLMKKAGVISKPEVIVVNT